MAFWTRTRQATDLEVRVERLERGYKALELEWNEMFEKMRRLHMRLAKRDKRAEESAEGSPGERSDNGQGVGNPLAFRILNPYGSR